MIPASRRVETPSRHRRDSSPGMMEVGGFFSDFEAVRCSAQAHRLGLIPIKYAFKPGKTKLREDVSNDEAAAMSSERDIQRRFRFTRDCDCDGYCDWCACTFKLHVKYDEVIKNVPEHEKNQPYTVTSINLESDDPDVFPVHFVSERERNTSSEPGIAIVKLAKGQEIKLSCIAKLGRVARRPHRLEIATETTHIDAAREPENRKNTRNRRDAGAARSTRSGRR